MTRLTKAERDAMRAHYAGTAMQTPLELLDHADAADAEIAKLRGIIRALVTHPHVSLGDLVYDVREREGAGWEGPGVKAWSDAVAAAEAAAKVTS